MSKFVLTFSNIVGDFTVDKELIGKQDPYIVFSAGAAKSQTKVRCFDTHACCRPNLSDACNARPRYFRTFRNAKIAVNVFN